MDEQVEALAEVIYEAFHGPRLGFDFNPDTEDGGFALPWILEKDGRGKDNFRRAAKAALDHLGAMEAKE